MSEIDFLKIMGERGFINQCTDLNELSALMKRKKIVAYVGFDATADSLHVGHLLSIMALRWFQKAGHKPLVVIGGGTTKIGDPSFKNTSRPMLSDDEIIKNENKIKKVFEKFLVFDETGHGALLLNNRDWLENLNFLSFLREFGQHFSVNRMLSFDSVKQRLDKEKTLSLLEFNYMVLQAFDFFKLSKSHDCVLQMGGSDQWGNIINGVELSRRMNGDTLFGMTVPLLSTSSGLKMGKTENGAIWLDERKTSPFDFWQFWRNTEDGDVFKFLKFFTELSKEEIDLVMKGGVNEAKERLATEITKMVHGEKRTMEIERTVSSMFKKKERDLGGLPKFDLKEMEDWESRDIVTVIKDMGITKSKGEARRLIENHGVKIDGKLVESDKIVMGKIDFKENGVVISIGKKKHVRIVI